MITAANVLKTPLRQASRLLLSITCPSKVDTFAMSPDGRHIAGGSRDGSVRIWDLVSGALIRWTRLTWSTDITESSDRSEDGPPPVDSLAYARDGSELFCMLGGYISTLDPETLSRKGRSLPLPCYDIVCMSVGPDSMRVALGSEDGTIYILDMEAHTVVSEIKAHKRAVRAIVSSRDGSRLVSASDDWEVYVWNVASGKRVGKRLKGLFSPVCAVAFLADENLIAIGSWGGDVEVWNTATGKQRGETWDTGFPVLFLAFSVDGSRIVTAVEIESEKRLRYFKANEDVKLPSLSEARSHLIGHFDDGSRIYAWAEQASVQVWDSGMLTRQSSLEDGHSDGVMSVAYSPDGSKIISGSEDRTVRMWDARTGKSLETAEMQHPSSVWFAAFSPDGSQIASGGYGSTIRIWDVQTGHLVHTLEVCQGWVRCGAYSPDGTRIVSGSFDNTVRLWDSANGRPIGEPGIGHTNDIRSVAFSPDGSYIASASDELAIRLWDGLTGEALDGLLAGHDNSVYCVVFSPDGTLLASGGYDCTIRIWDVKKRSSIGNPLEGHTGAILCLTFTPDGKQIFSSSADRTIRCWDARSGMLVGRPLSGHSGAVRSLAISHDGRHIVSGGDKAIRIWDSSTFCWDSDLSLASCGRLGPEKIPAHIEDDGWLHTVDGGLLLYIPPEHRRAVCDMSSLCISQDEGDQPIRILWDRLCHGDKWTEIGKEL